MVAVRAQAIGRERDAEAVIARRRGHDRRVRITGERGGHGDERAPYLERPGRLQRLELQPDVGPEQWCRNHGCDGEVSPDDRGRLGDLARIGNPDGSHGHSLPVWASARA